MKTISIEDAKVISDKVSNYLENAQQLRAMLAKARADMLLAIEVGDRAARERLSEEIEELRKALFKVISESTNMIKDMSESEIVHGTGAEHEKS